MLARTQKLDARFAVPTAEEKLAIMSLESDYPVADPHSFPRYIVSFFAGGNALVSKELYEAYANVDNVHRHVQHCPFPGCNNRLALEGELLPDFSELEIAKHFGRLIATGHGALGTDQEILLTEELE
jgi:hypothetical protein